jgi:hypothetical protein
VDGISDGPTLSKYQNFVGGPPVRVNLLIYERGDCLRFTRNVRILHDPNLARAVRGHLG